MLKAAGIGAILPLQVVAEFANVCRKKTLVEPDAIRSWTSRLIQAFRIVPTRPEHIDAALDTADRYRLAFFDALICVVASTEGAARLFSEDMHDGLVVNGLRIINPFASANDETVSVFLGSADA